MTEAYERDNLQDVRDTQNLMHDIVLKGGDVKMNPPKCFTHELSIRL